VTGVTADELRATGLLAELDDATIAHWIAAGTVVCEPAGTVVAEQESTAKRVTFVLDGELEAKLIVDDHVEPGSRHIAPTFIGAIPVLTETPFAVRMEAATDVRLMTVEPDDFFDLVVASPPVLRRILRLVRPVVTSITAGEQNRERLASLGTMAAGLAHELNNPAAAARRAAASLAEALTVLETTMDRFVESGIEREDAAKLIAMKRVALERAAVAPELDALAAADAEDALSDALEAHGIAEPWRLVEPLAAAGLDEAWLDELLAIGAPDPAGVLDWIGTTLSAQGIAAELTESTERMSDLVRAIKEYAYVDRGGELIAVDVRAGIDTTLRVMKHKYKHTAIRVERDYADDLPDVIAYGPELNQVWTNLIDNAIDALGESGTIAISAAVDGPCVRVDIADDGPGMPADVRARIFDPFFTTKDVGQGTGLGLDAVRRIVVDRHRGSVTVDSEPGRTVFHVWIPFEGASREIASKP
jgi:signal transduction histidine kinase